MFVIKRNGRSEAVHFDKIANRISKLAYGLNVQFVEPNIVVQKVIAGFYKGITSSELDELAAETAAHLTSVHPDYGVLAARIAISNLHKNTFKSFTEVTALLFSKKMINPAVNDFIVANGEALNSAIVYDRDFNFDYFGFKTLERSYLLRDGTTRVVVERPQHMLMRVSCGIHSGSVENAIETYNMMSNRLFIHASPTLFNSGTNYPQLSSCFLLTMLGDSIDGIYDTLKQCAVISKHAGGIGLAVSNVRASGSYIAGTNGQSNGLVPMLRVFNNTARYVDQGGGKRKGAFAIYLEPWHRDIYAFLELKKNHGVDEDRARDLFYGLWVPDLFMKRVEQDASWSLFCPNECPGLMDVWGEAFDTLYLQYEASMFATKIKARELWQAILDAQTETGNPYMLFKDASNRKSNQQNLGTIHCSNLCTEIIEYTSKDEIAVCNLASVSLPQMVVGKVFDHSKLFEVVTVMTKNLNKIIDINHYPVKEASNSNFRHRPIGIGVQGLADAFLLLKFPFDSAEAQQLNKDIFETIYLAACTASKDLAKLHGPYSSYAGSPISKGIFQFDMWGVTPSRTEEWTALRKEIATHGVRNSLLIAPMPTASTSQILGNNEAIEAYTSNLYVRRTLAGEFICVSRHLLNDLVELGLWSPQMKDKLIAHNGSVQNIKEIPASLKNMYKTVWEISQRTIIDMSADRGAYIDQSQSLNIHMTNITTAKLSSMHFHAWKKGLKTGMYYLRSKSAADPIKFSIDHETVKEAAATKSNEILMCSLKNKEACEMCSA